MFSLQNDYRNFGIDWQGPIPEPSPDVVDVPDTNCPFSDDQMHLLPNTDGLNYVEGIEVYQHITNLIPHV